MKRIILIFLLATLFCQGQQSSTNRNNFSITIIDTVIQIGTDGLGRSGGYTTDFMLDKYQHRKYVANQDTIKVYGFGYRQPMTQIYIDTISYSDSKNLYDFLRKKGLNTLPKHIASNDNHGIISTIDISGDSLPSVTLIDDRADYQPFQDILIQVDKLVKIKKIRMYND